MFHFLLNLYIFVVLATILICINKGKYIEESIYNIMKEAKDEKQAKDVATGISKSFMILSFVPILNIAVLFAVIIYSCVANRRDVMDVIINVIRKEKGENP